MMDTTISVLIRTTSCTMLAATMALIFIRIARIQSPRVHRAIWVLVLLQGWVFVPVAVRLPVDVLPIETAVMIAEVPHAGSVEVAVTDGIGAGTNVQQRESTATKVPWVATVWCGGVFLIVIYWTWRYGQMWHRVPLGRKSTRSDWQTEWEAARRSSGVKSPCDFRLIDDIGPLCCFVPFFYLVLVPEKLWQVLSSQQRRAILRHELAHLKRHDLWTSVAVRVLALPQWFNPIAWLVVRAFDDAAEWACDEIVTKTTDEGHRTTYASALLCIAESKFTILPSSVAAKGGSLATRIRRLIQPSLTEDTMVKKITLTALFIGLLFAHAIRIESVAAENEPLLPPQVAEGEVYAQPVTVARQAELARTGLTPYRVAPPDILLINAVSLSPKAPYRINQSDRLRVDSKGLQSRIAGTFQVDSNGMLILGSDDLSVKVAGLTLKEAQKAVAAHLRGTAPGVRIGLSIVQPTGVRQVVGEHLVGPDGAVNLGKYGKANVAGKTLEEVRKAVEAQLAEHFDEPQVDVEVLAYNSKCFYVVSQMGAGKDYITRIPCTGAETVLDGIAQIGGLKNVSEHRIWLSRPNANGDGHKVLMVDWDAITRGADASTNYQLLPGDRVFISEGEANKSPKAQDNVKLQIRIIRDPHGNLEEFESLKNGPMMRAKTEPTLATLRILGRNDLIDTVAAPAVICKAGKTAQVTIQGASFEAAKDVNGISIDATPTVDGDAKLTLTTEVNIDHRRGNLGVSMASLVEEGTTLVMRAHPMPHRNEAEQRDQSSDAIYVVITPELVR